MPHNNSLWKNMIAARGSTDAEAKEDGSVKPWVERGTSGVQGT